MTKLEQGVRSKTSEQWLVVVVVLGAPHSHNDTETKTSLMPLASWELVKSTSAQRPLLLVQSKELHGFSVLLLME